MGGGSGGAYVKEENIMVVGCAWGKSVKREENYYIIFNLFLFSKSANGAKNWDGGKSQQHHYLSSPGSLEAEKHPLEVLHGLSGQKCTWV